MRRLRAWGERALERELAKVTAELEAFRPKAGARHSIQVPSPEELPRVLEELRARLERERVIYGDIHSGSRTELHR